MQVIARMIRDGGETATAPVEAGDTLRGSDEVQIRVKVTRDAYVYVIAYTTGSRSALLLHPVSGRSEDALIESGEERLVPGPDRYLSLQDKAGFDTFYAIATAEPTGSLATLLVRMESEGDDYAAVTTTVRQRFPLAEALTIRNAGDQPLVAAAQGISTGSRATGAGSRGTTPQPSTAIAGIADPQLDVEAMECLYAWLIGGVRGGVSISPQATLETLQENSTFTRAGCPVVPALAAVAGSAGQSAGESADSAVGERLPASGETVAMAELAAVMSAPAFAAPEGPLPQPDDSSGASDAASDSPFAGAAPPTLAPPKGALLLALATEPDAEEPIRSIDVTAEGNVSSAVVLVVTPTATGTGVLLDYAGQVLTNWHLVRGYPDVSVIFKTPEGAAPSSTRSRSARVVRLSKTADLALLRIDKLPAGINPVRIASTNEIRNGDVVHTVGHPGNGVWTYTLGKIGQVKSGSSWYAGHNLLHRGSVIFAELPEDPGGPGAPLFNNRLELVGIGATPRSIRGVLTGVSVETIRKFLQAPPAEAGSPAGG